MFQYAAGRRLAHRHGAEFRLDHGFLEAARDVATSRRFELHHLNVRNGRASSADCSAIARHGLGLVSRTISGLLPLERQISRSKRVVRERSYRFDSAILDLPDNVYLEGYWQSERYFADITGILCDEFAVSTPLAGDNLRIAETMNGCCAVSLHVRRGDYVTDRRTAAIHGVCGLEYYKSAAADIIKRVDAPHFFVFSDDPLWVKENLSLPSPTTFVDHNGPDQGYEDLRLMSLCRHHIIANSSFSWWGAWLGSNPGKIVIAPKRWFNDENIDTTDLIPEVWIRI
jgi:hypothetical protein